MRFIAFCLLLLVIGGCKGKKSVPAGILPPDKMEQVLWDMFQADVFLRDFVINKDTTVNDSIISAGVYEKVFQYNKINRAKFDTSFAYYRQHPTLLKEVLDSVHARGTRTSAAPHFPAPKADTSRTPKIDTNLIKRIKKPRLPDATKVQ